MTTHLKKAIIFDFGKVLVEWDPRPIFQRHFSATSPAVDAFLSEIEFLEWNTQQDGGHLFADAIVEHSAKFPQYAHILPDYDTHWKNSITGPIEGSVRILRRLKQAGYPLYGLSNFSAEKFPIIQQQYEFFNWFDDILLSGNIRLLKPDPAIFHFLLEKIGRKAEECIFIDDNSANVTSAAALGFTAIQFHSPTQLEDELQELGIL